MHGMNRFNAFHLDDDDILDYQVDPIAQFDFFAIIDDRQADLASDVKSAFCQFMLKTGLICALQQSGAEQRVDLHRTGNDFACDLVDAEIVNGSCSCHSNCIPQSSCFPL